MAVVVQAAQVVVVAIVSQLFTSLVGWSSDACLGLLSAIRSLSERRGRGLPAWPLRCGRSHLTDQLSPETQYYQ